MLALLLLLLLPLPLLFLLRLLLLLLFLQPSFLYMFLAFLSTAFTILASFLPYATKSTAQVYIHYTDTIAQGFDALVPVLALIGSPGQGISFVGRTYSCYSRTALIFIREARF